METQSSVERQTSGTPTQDNSPSVGGVDSGNRAPEASSVQMNINGMPVVTAAGGQQLLMQQSAGSAEAAAFAQSTALATQLAQAGLLQTQGGVPFFIQGPGGMPLNFVQSEQAQGLVVSQAQQFVPQSPVQQNSLASGESPAPHTPGSNSLGSPAPQMEGPGTPRSETPAAPPAHIITQGALDLQMQAQLHNAHKIHALQAQAQAQSQQQREQAELIAQAQAKAQQAELAKTLKPPKKPLTPYMRFSKSVWPRVKEQNMGLSVCEIGASIGKMWRELTEEEKSRYNDDFTADKVRYDEDLQKYLKLTGLQASDLVKPRTRKKKAPQHAVHAPVQHVQQDKHHHQSAVQQQQQQLPMHLFPGQQMSPNQATMMFQSQLAAAAQSAQTPAPQAQSQANGPQSQPTVTYQQGVNGQITQVISDPNNLPGFAQIWNQQEGSTEGQGQDAATATPGQVASLTAYLNMIQQAQAAHLQHQVAQQQAQAIEATPSQPEARQESPQPEQSAGWNWHQPNTSTAETSGGNRSAARTPVSEHSVSEAATSADNTPSTQAQEAKRNVPTAEMLVASTAHSLYNSYSYNPWSAYPSQGQFGNAGKAIDTKEGVLEKEAVHLKNAVSEKTKEVERLTLELEKAYQIIEHLKQQNMALNNSLALITTQAHSSHGSHNGSHSHLTQSEANSG